MVMVNNGERIVIADSNRDKVRGCVQPRCGGCVQSPGPPAGADRRDQVGNDARQFALEPNGTTLLVTNTDSHQVQAVDISHLP